jgi:predicted nucleic acid-binding protein
VLYVLDSSALVKRYHQESGSEVVTRLFEEPASLLLINTLSLSEVARALERLHQRGYYSVGDVRLALQRLYRDCWSGRIGVVDVTQPLIFEANELILTHRLSAPDAIILATALRVHSYHPVFVTADTRSGLLPAAAACGLSTLNPLTPPAL